MSWLPREMAPGFGRRAPARAIEIMGRREAMVLRHTRTHE